MFIETFLLHLRISKKIISINMAKSSTKQKLECLEGWIRQTKFNEKIKKY